MPSSILLFILSYTTCLTIKHRVPLDISIPEVNLLEDSSLSHDIEIESGTRHIHLSTSSKELLPHLITILQKHSAPPSSIVSITDTLSNLSNQNLTEEELLKTGNHTFAIFFINEIVGSTLDPKKLIDHSLLNSLKVYISSDADLALQMGVPFPGVYGYNAYDKVDYKLNFRGFTQDISLLLTPILKELTVESLKLYDDSQLPKFFLFYDELSEHSSNFFGEIGVYEECARKYRDKIKVGMLAYKREKPSLTHFQINENNLPAMVCIYDKIKYRSVNLDGSKFSEYISSFIEGNEKGWEMSSDEPADNGTRNVKVVTRNNYRGFFELGDNKNHRDALVVFSAPNCRFCVELKPIIESLGELVNKNGNDEVVVGSVDMTVNDFPEFDVKGYPTIVLVSQGKIFYYNGKRSVEEMAQFISIKGKSKIDLLTGTKNEVKESEEIKDRESVDEENYEDNYKEEL